MALERKGRNHGRRGGSSEIAPHALPNPTGTPADRSLLTREIGQKLKVTRRQQQLSLRALAAKVDFSASFLSQVESGQVSPSIGSLDRIAQALGMHLSDLLSRPISTNGPVLRHGRQASLHSEWSHATIESLLPAEVRTKTGIVLMRIEPGGQSGKLSSTSPADKELAFCVRGRATVTIAEKRYNLREGDSIFYDAEPIARWQNSGKKIAEVMLISLRSPGS